MRTCTQTRSTCIRIPSGKSCRDFVIRTAVHCCRDPFAIRGSIYDPWTSKWFMDLFPCVRNRYSVTDTDQRRNLVRRIFRKSFKKKVRENIRILLRKDYVFYFRFFVHIILQVFPGLFPVFFLDPFSKNCRYESAEPSAGKYPVGIFRMSRIFPTVPTDLFPVDNNEKIRRVSPPDFSEKNVVII